MTKTLALIAALGVVVAAPAFADTNTFYGLVDGALANVSMTGQKSQTLAVSGGLATSRLGFKGSEDLGDGLKAIYTLEYALDIEQNGPVGTAPSIANSTTTARQQLVGLSGSFGTVATGRLQTTGYDFEVKYDPLGGSLVSPIQNLNSAKQFLIGTTAQAARASRAFAYTTPNLSGFTVSVDYSTALAAGLGNLGLSNAAADANITATLAGAYYDQGPVSVGLVYAETSAPAQATAGSIDNEKEWALGGSYDFGVAKVLGTYASTHNDATVAAGAFTDPGASDKLWSLSGVIPAGPGNVVLSYAKVKVGTDASGNSDTSSYTAAYTYGLSKTLTVYGAYSHVSDGSGTNLYSTSNSVLAGAGTGGVAGSNFGATSGLVAVGISKKF